MDFATLFQEHFQKMIWVLRGRGKKREDAEDILQDSFERLLIYQKNGHRIRKPAAMLATVACNLAIDHHRRERKHLYDRRPVDEIPLPSLAPGPEEVIDFERACDHLRQALVEAVGRRACDVYFLQFFGLTHEEIAKKLGISTDTVGRDIEKALDAMLERGDGA